MLRSPGVFVTDQVNLDRMRIPASELMRDHWDRYRKCLHRSVEFGLPLYMQHDMHRLVGWSRQLGLYADSEMVRVLGVVEEPETEQEHAELEARVAALSRPRLHAAPRHRCRMRFLPPSPPPVG